jgi:hypothetical protein
MTNARVKLMRLTDALRRTILRIVRLQAAVDEDRHANSVKICNCRICLSAYEWTREFGEALQQSEGAAGFFGC